MLYKTKPILIKKVWGGNRLKDYGKNFDGNIGESIEYIGKSEGIPISIKLIDARDNLSIQVHPDENIAKKLGDGDIGKDEFWVVLEGGEDSEIFYGFKKKYSKKEIENSVMDGSIIYMLNRVKVKKGDCIFIPSGTVHALGKGVMVYELQQSSDITYRLYDWDRGKTDENRVLNIEKALYSIIHSTSSYEIKNIYNIMEKNVPIIDIVDCRHFKSRYVFLEAKESIMQECGQFKIITAICGIGIIEYKGRKEIIKKGESCVITQNIEEYLQITGITSFRYIESLCKF